MYNWYAVNTGKLCPEGWHVPTDADWTILTNYLAGPDQAGGALKEAGIVFWGSPNEGASNASGFSARPGGQRINDGIFYRLGAQGFWWTTTEADAGTSWFRSMSYSGTGVTRGSIDKTRGMSVRCLKD
jgi:uncharacterized protein (TIGR02145 family)